MSWRAGGAHRLRCREVACLVVHAAPPAQAFAPAPRPAIPADASLLHQGRGFRRRHRAHAAAAGAATPVARQLRCAAAACASRRPPSAAGLPPSATSAASRPPPQPQGRIVKVTMKIGSQAEDPQKGWLGVQMDTLELPLALALGLAQRQRRAHPRGGRQQPGRTGGATLRRYRRRPQRPPVAHSERAALSACRRWRRARTRSWRCGASPADGGDFLQTLRRLARWRKRPRHVSSGPDVRNRHRRGARRRRGREPGTARARPPATRAP